MEILPQLIVNGIVTGSIYALVALGVTLVFGLTRLANFAQGELVTIGAVVTWEMYSLGVPYVVALAVAGLVGGIVGVGLERFGFRFTRANPINGFILSLGIIFVIQGILTEHYGATIFPAIPVLQETFTIGTVHLTAQDVFVVAVAAALTALLFAWLKLTQVGRAIRAYAQDPDTTALMGVDTNRIVQSMFLVGSALASIAGGLLSMLFSFDVNLGSNYIVTAFAVSLIGGLGSAPGAVIAGLAVGLSQSFGGAYISSAWSEMFGYLTMIIILLIRPTGLFAGAEGAHV
jgi:branched-chain amino acid transport system permease protein